MALQRLMRWKSLDPNKVQFVVGIGIVVILGIAWKAGWEILTSDKWDILLAVAGVVLAVVVLLPLLQEPLISRVVRACIAAIVTGVLYFVFTTIGPYQDDLPAYDIGVWLIGFAAGLLSRSWIVVVLVPLVLVLTGGLWNLLACGYCPPGSQPGNPAFAGIVSVGFLLSPAPFGAAVGVLIGNVVAWLNGQQGLGADVLKQGRWKQYAASVAFGLGSVAIVLVSIMGVNAVTRSLPVEEAHFVPGPLWDGTGPRQLWMEGRVSQAEMEAYDEIPLYWFGESFGGYNLSQMRIYRYPRTGQSDQPGIAYGRCTALPCSYGIGIGLQVICTNDPLEKFIAKEGKGMVRGNAVLVRKTESTALIMAGSTFIDIGILLPLDAESISIDAAIEQLRGIGVNASIGPGDPLPAPTRDACPW